MLSYIKQTGLFIIAGIIVTSSVNAADNLLDRAVPREKKPISIGWKIGYAAGFAGSAGSAILNLKNGTKSIELAQCCAADAILLKKSYTRGAIWHLGSSAFNILVMTLCYHGLSR